MSSVALPPFVSASVARSQYVALLLQSQEEVSLCAELVGALGNSSTDTTTRNALSLRFTNLQEHSRLLSAHLKILSIDESERRKLVAKVKNLQGNILQLFTKIPSELHTHRVKHEKPEVHCAKIKKTLPTVVAPKFNSPDSKLEELGNIYQIALRPCFDARKELSKTKAESIATYQKAIAPLRADADKLLQLREAQRIEVRIFERERESLLNRRESLQNNKKAHDAHKGKETSSEQEVELEEALDAITKKLQELSLRHAIAENELHSRLRINQKQIQEIERAHKMNMDDLHASSAQTEQEIAELEEEYAIAAESLRKY